MKLHDLLFEAFENATDEDIYYYDKINKNIIPFKTKNLSFLAEVDADKADPDELPEEEKALLEILSSIAEGNKRYYRIPKKSDTDEFQILDMFGSFFYNDEESLEFEKIVESNKLKKCYDFLKKTKQYDKYTIFRDNLHHNFIDSFINDNELVTKKITKAGYNKLLNLAMDINKLEPWKTFSDVDAIRITENKDYDEDQEYAFTILGNAEKVYGIVIYYDKENATDTINELFIRNEISELDPDSLLPMVNFNYYAIYFDNFNHLFTHEAQQNVEKFVDNYDKNGVYPSFVSFEIGKFPVEITSQTDVKIIERALNLFKLFYTKFTQENVLALDRPNLSIDVKVRRKKVEYDLHHIFNDGDVLYSPSALEDDLKKEIRNELRICNDVGYLNVHVIPSPDENNTAHLIMILYDATKDQIVGIDELRILSNSFNNCFQLTFGKLAENKRIPKTIRVTNYLCYYALLDLVHDKLNIEISSNNPTLDIFNDILKEATSDKTPIC